MLKDPLDDSASIRMCGERVDLAIEGIDNELDVLRQDSLDCLLDNMVPVLVLDAFENVSLEFANENVLSLWSDVLECFLYDATAVHLHGEGEHVSLHECGEKLLVVLCTEFKELLDHVVSKNVGHEGESDWVDFFKHELLVFERAGFETLLNETRAVLVRAELANVSCKVSDFVLAGLVCTKVVEDS